MSQNKKLISEELMHQIDVVHRSMKNLGTFSTTYMEKDATAVFNHYACLNAVDSCAYPEFSTIEETCGEFFLDLYHADSNENFMYFATSGSSEALFMSMLFMKRHWLKYTSQNKKKPNFIIGSNGHTAWHKAATYLDVELRQVPVHPDNLILDESQLIHHIDANTIGIGCTLGATTTLLYDNVEKINTLLNEYREQHNVFIPMHVDAAGGGFIAPFQHHNVVWDFRLNHVLSINVSCHKFGMVYPSMGWLCVRKEISSEDLAHESHYLGKPIKRYPIQFSHSASHLFTQCYYVKTLGKQGYEKIISQLFVRANQLTKLLLAFDGIKIITPNQTPNLPGIIFTFDSSQSEHNLAGLTSYLSAKGWHLPTFRLPLPSNALVARIIVRHGFTEDLMYAFIKEMHNYFASTPE